MNHRLKNTQFIFILLSLLMIIIFILGSLIPYLQMRKYHQIVAKGGDFQNILENDFIFSPRTSATDLICFEITSHLDVPVTKSYAEVKKEYKEAVPFLQNVVIRCHDSLEKNIDPMARFFMSNIYSYLGHLTDQKEYFDKADNIINGIFKESPYRQNFVLFKISNLLFKRDFKEAKKNIVYFSSINPKSVEVKYYSNILDNLGIK